MSKISKILLFGGTTEGREIADFCKLSQIDIDIRVATDYGKEVMQNAENVFAGRLDEQDIISLIKTKAYTKVIDATHPYAVVATENIKNSCETLNVEYIRVKRETEVYNTDDLQYFDEIEQAVEYLNSFEGNILSTIGSKELVKLSSLKRLDERLIVRAIPFDFALKQCSEIGVPAKNIVLMQGPFDVDLNIALMKKYNIKFLLTKETGKSGGFDEKILSAKAMNVKVIVISRPSDDGINLDELKSKLRLW